MGLGQRGIEFNRPLRGAANFGRSLVVGNYSAIKEKDVRISNPGMGLRVIWIFGYRLVELLQGFVKALARALLQIKASFHIKLVGLGIFRGMLLLFAAYLQPQLAGNVGGNVVLYGSDIGGLPLALLTSDLRAVAHIHHFSRDVERVPALREAAYNYSSNFKLVTDLQRILLCLPVAENCRAGHHAQLWQPR